MKQFLIGFLLVAMAGAMLPGLGLAGFLVVGTLLTAAMSGALDKLSITRQWYDRVAGVTVTEANGQLGGVITTNDRVVGLTITGVTEGIYTAGTPISVASLDDVTAAGITDTGNAFAFRHCTEFYQQAPVGSKLYLMLCPPTMTVADMSDNTNAASAKKLYLYAAGEIKVMGVLADDKAIVTAGGTITTTASLNADVYTAASNLKTMEIAARAAQMPFRGIIGGSSYSGTASTLTNQTTGTSNNKVAILIGDTVSHDATYTSAAIGLLLGQVAKCGVEEKISKREKGPLSNTTAYLKTTTMTGYTGTDLATIAGKGYITWAKDANVSGYFFSHDKMLTVSTDDYAILARCRTIDKAHIIAYLVCQPQVENDIPTLEGGLPDPGWCAWMENEVEKAVKLAMPIKKEISSVTCFIDRAQQVTQDSELDVVLKVRPKGYLTDINVVVSFQL